MTVENVTVDGVVQMEGKAGEPAGVDECVGASKRGDDVLQLVFGFWGLGRRILAWEGGGEGGGR